MFQFDLQNPTQHGPKLRRRNKSGKEQKRSLKDGDFEGLTSVKRIAPKRCKDRRVRMEAVRVVTELLSQKYFVEKLP
jgi:hypothetical protein